MESLEIRIAMAFELEQIVALWKRFMEEIVPEIEPEIAELGWTTRLKKQIADSKVLVAVKGQTLVGFIAYVDHHNWQLLPENVAYIVDFYVAPEARKSPAAQNLFSNLKELISMKYAAIWTNTHITNKRMQTLLKRWRFQELENFTIQGISDHVYYQLDQDTR